MSGTSERSESGDATGYGESPDTADLPEVQVGSRDGGSGGAAGGGAELTTDDEAQLDDSVVRGGNASS